MLVIWQNPELDLSNRREIIKIIVRILRRRRPDAPKEWIVKIPDMARRFEDKMYRMAKSREEYLNRATIGKRMRDIALRLLSDPTN